MSLPSNYKQVASTPTSGQSSRKLNLNFVKIKFVEIQPQKQRILKPFFDVVEGHDKLI